MDKSIIELRNGNLSDFELRKQSRRLTGYTLFLSFFFLEWKELTPDVRLNELGVYLRGEENGSDSDSDSDSIVSFPSIVHADVIRHAARRWNKFSPAKRESWGVRAHRLNAMPVLGRFTSIPSSLSNEMICDMITKEWRRTCKVLRGLVLREPTRIASQRNYMMSVPGEKTKVGTHSYCRAYMSPIMFHCIFGKDLCNLHTTEIIYRKKKCVVVHIASMQRIAEIFTVRGLCGVTLDMSGIKHSCAGKVNVVRNGMNVSGFVMKERRSRWSLVLANKEEVTLKRVRWDDEQAYIYDESSRNSRSLRITSYSPIRMKFVEGCQNNWQTMWCRCALRDGEIVQQLSS